MKSSNESGAFLSWKPICYTSHTRKVSSSKRIKNYKLQPYHFASDSINSSGLAFAFFGSSLVNRTHVEASNVSFGGPKDKLYYNVSQYTAWSDTYLFSFIAFILITLCSEKNTHSPFFISPCKMLRFAQNFQGMFSRKRVFHR